MDELERPPSLLPRLAFGVAAVFVALAVIGWIVGAVLSALRLLALVGVCVLVLWAVLAGRGE